MTTEADALANMMAADSRRVDQLVEDVGVVKGRMESVHTGVNELRSALAVLVKHEVLMNEHARIAVSVSSDVAALDVRVQAIECEMPQLKESRQWVVRGMLLVLAMVGLALLALVVNGGARP